MRLFSSLCRGSAGNPSVSSVNVGSDWSQRKIQWRTLLSSFGAESRLCWNVRIVHVRSSTFRACWHSGPARTEVCTTPFFPSSQSPPDGGALGRAAHEEKNRGASLFSSCTRRKKSKSREKKSTFLVYSQHFDFPESRCAADVAFLLLLLLWVGSEDICTFEPNVHAQSESSPGCQSS